MSATIQGAIGYVHSLMTAPPGLIPGIDTRANVRFIRRSIRLVQTFP